VGQAVSPAQRKEALTVRDSRLAPRSEPLAVDEE
jgi:hypothetical protein